MSLPARFSTIAACAALASPLAAQGQLWTVSANACPDVDFASVQDAVDAAADGDTIVVEGDFALVGLDVDGKELTLIGHGQVPGPGGVSQGPSYVRNVPAGSRVTIQGFQFIGELRIRDNGGEVWIEGCAFDPVPAPFTPAVSIENSAAVVLVRSDASRGWPAIESTASSLHAYDCELRGSDGIDGDFADLVPPQSGGDSLRVDGGFLFLSGCTVEGGDGGDAFGPIFVPGYCQEGDAGDGLVVDALAETHVLDSVVTAGAPGIVCGATAAPGLAVSGAGAAAVDFPSGTARRILPDAAGPAPELTSAMHTLEGEPGDLAFVALGFRLAPFYLPGLSGSFLLSAPFWFPAGSLPAGTAPFDLVLPAGVVAPGESLPVLLQPLFLSASALLVLGAPTALSVVDQAYAVAGNCSPSDVFHVDDDAPGDPAPGDPLVSDPFEDGSPLHPYDSIQEAIDGAIAGNVILVEDGLYGESGIHLDGKAIVIRSVNGPAGCVVASAPASPTFLLGVGAGPGTVIDGLTLANPVSVSGSPTIARCVIGSTGAGSNLLGVGSSLFQACRFDAVPTNVFSGSPRFFDCAFEGGGTTGLLNVLGAATVSNCTLLGAASGGPSAGSALTVAGSVTLTNSIVWGNATLPSGSIFVGSGGSLTVSYSDVEGGQAQVGTAAGASVVFGPGNLDTDPLFLPGDFHLAPTSPCIDAGDPAYVKLPGETDVDGQHRLNGVIDQGADEVY